MRSTIVKPSNGQTGKSKPRGQTRNKSGGLGLRRLTKRQRQKIGRILMFVFLIVFVFTIVGGVVAISVKPAGH